MKSSQNQTRHRKQSFAPLTPIKQMMEESFHLMKQKCIHWHQQKSCAILQVSYYLHSEPENLFPINMKHTVVMNR